VPVVAADEDCSFEEHVPDRQAEVEGDVTEPGVNGSG
jgi:hypothetical protein